MKRILTIFATLATVLCLHADVNPSSKVRSIFRNRPLVFESQDGRNFTSWSPEQRILVGAEGWELLLPGASTQITMQIVGAKPSGKKVHTEQPVPVNTVYLKGSSKKDWHASTTAYKKVRFPEVLPGVDVAYYGDGQKLEFDFIVAPGADPNAVRLQFKGHDRLEVDRDGELRIYNGNSPLIQKLPAVYQVRKNGMNLVDAHYVLRADGNVGFKLGAYDRSLPLVIDPVVDYTFYLGDVAKDVATNIVRDPAGFLYVGGITLSTNFPVYGQAAQNSAQGDVDLFVTKIDPNAKPEDAVVYSSFIGGAAAESLSAMLVGSDGLLYIAGTTASTNFPVSSNAAYPTSLTNGDGFVAKMDTNIVGTDTFRYSTYLGGTKSDVVTGAALAADGSIAVTGYTESTDFPIVGTAFQGTNAGQADGFIAYFGSAGNLAYSTYFGGTGSDRGNAIAIDSDGGLIVGGFTSSGDFPLGPTPFRSYRSGLSDVVLLKVTLTGQLVYSSYLGGGDLEEIEAMTWYAPGQVAITGYTTSIDFPTTQNAFQRFRRGPSDAFLSVLDVKAAGDSSLVYSTLYGGSGAESGVDVRADANGLITLVGYTISRDMPVTANALQSTYQGGGSDGFVVQMTPGSAPSFATYVGGLGTDLIYSLALDPAGRIFITGSTTSRAIPTGNPYYHFGEQVNTDVYILRINPRD